MKVRPWAGVGVLGETQDVRGRLAEVGPKQASLFSPERYQERVREAYARVDVRFGG